MNALILGSNPEPLLDYIPRRDFLLIDDGRLIDQVPCRARSFDVRKHSFNPLKDIGYRTALDFMAVLDAVFPEGENTLTRQNTNYQILNALLAKPKSLPTLVKDTKETHHAYQLIQRLLLSPVLMSVFTGRAGFSFTGTILARIDRAQLGDFDAFVLGNLLISQYQGTVIVPDFGFYAHKGHVTLIHQNRLIAGVRSLDQVPKLRNELIQIEEKIPSQCTPDDAKTLALYEGLYPDPLREDSDYNKFIYRAIRPA